jgi:ATP-dependent RNA helicase RhlE
VNYDLPNEPETYVHRIGRTARAGHSGIAFSFCTSEDRSFLHDIERLIRMRLTVAVTPNASDMRTPEPQEIVERVVEQRGQGRHSGRGSSANADATAGAEGRRNPRGRRNRNGAGNSAGGRDSGHRRASTGHNPAGRGNENRGEVRSDAAQAPRPEGQRPAPRHDAKPRDTRPAHMRGGQAQEGQTHGNSSGNRKRKGGERSYVREYYSNDR